MHYNAKGYWRFPEAFLCFCLLKMVWEKWPFPFNNIGKWNCRGNTVTCVLITGTHFSCLESSFVFFYRNQWVSTPDTWAKPAASEHLPDLVKIRFLGVNHGPCESEFSTVGFKVCVCVKLLEILMCDQIRNLLLVIFL